MECFFISESNNNNEEDDVLLELHDESIAQIPRIGETVSITEYETNRLDSRDKEIILYQVKDIRHEFFCNKEWGNNWVQFIYIILNKIV